MERNTKPHACTADLLSWSLTPQPPTASPQRSHSHSHSHQPSDGIRKAVFGGEVTDEEVESFNTRKPCSGYKLKEITGSGIFADNDMSELIVDNTPNSKTGIRLCQQAVALISNISFGEDESVSPKKPATVAEVAKRRELSGTLESESEASLKKQLSDAKCKELSGHDIFAPSPEILPRTTPARALALKENFGMGEPAPRNVHTSIKVSHPARGLSNIMSTEETVQKTAKKISNQKFAHLSGNDIFKGDATPSSAEKSLSSAKLREISGSNIFADGKAESRDNLRGARKPPGGVSSIALV